MVTFHNKNGHSFCHINLAYYVFIFRADDTVNFPMSCWNTVYKPGSESFFTLTTFPFRLFQMLHSFWAVVTLLFSKIEIITLFF